MEHNNTVHSDKSEMGKDDFSEVLKTTAEYLRGIRQDTEVIKAGIMDPEKSGFKAIANLLSQQGNAIAKNTNENAVTLSKPKLLVVNMV